MIFQIGFDVNQFNHTTYISNGYGIVCMQQRFTRAE